MDIKQKLLLFLYENRHLHRRIKFNEVFVGCELRPVDVRYLLLDLLNNKIIDLHPYYFELGNREAGVLKGFNNSHLEGKLTPVVGEQYVKDNYLSKNEPIPTIQAENVVYNTGNISAPLNQGRDLVDIDQSQSKTLTETTPQVAPNANILITSISWLVNTISKHIGLTISGVIIAVIAGYMLYYFRLNGDRPQSLYQTTSDTTTTQKHDTTFGK